MKTKTKLCEDCNKNKLYFPIGYGKPPFLCDSCRKARFRKQLLGHQIINKEPMTIWIPNDENKFDSPHLVRANNIEFINNHLMFYLGKILIFKIWIKEGKWQKYKDIKEAIKGENIRIS